LLPYLGENVAFIPVRGGSKSIPFKNIKVINGKPLVAWVLEAANSCQDIDHIVVSTDSEKIRKVIKAFNFEKVQIIDRSVEVSTDEASTEAVIMEFANYYNFENIVLIQATSPLLNHNDISKGIDLIKKDYVDSVLSVVRQKRFIWKDDGNGAFPINYDIYNRPRRQEFEGFLVENGAFYITTRYNLIKSGNRLSGHIETVEMKEETYYEIDEPNDWTIVEKLMEISNN
jgi:CMP-N-acetylneuraminic acid synthetase